MTDAAETSYALLLTSESEPVRAAQRLRHQVFYEDMGAVLGTPVAGRDVERIDAFCDHLVVVDRSGTVVGTDRLLPPERARAAGGLYSDDKFDLATLAPLRPQLVETGRSCVHPNHRTGGVIGLMWAGLARYLLLTRTRWLGGCVNVPLGDGGALAAWVWQHLRTRHLAPVEHRVTPLRPWDPIGAPRLLRPTLPPLLRGYLRLGAQVCGPPAYGPSCHCADFFVLLDSERISQRYWRYFLGDPG
jgi:putative hemolysin